MLKRNIYIYIVVVVCLVFFFLPQIVAMIYGRRKYSSKYGMVMRVCNMSLVCQGKVLTFVAPGQEFNPPVFHISLSQIWLESQAEVVFNPSSAFLGGL